MIDSVPAAVVIARPGSSGHLVELVIDHVHVISMSEIAAKEFMASLSCDLRWRLGHKGNPQLPLAAHRREISEHVALTLIADMAMFLRQRKAENADLRE